MKKLYHFAAAMLVGLTAAASVSAAPAVTEILQNMENVEKLGEDVTVRAKLTMETPDLILLDYEMPVLNGSNCV